MLMKEYRICMPLTVEEVGEVFLHTNPYRESPQDGAAAVCPPPPPAESWCKAAEGVM